jgi:hypothetical protein
MLVGAEEDGEPNKAEHIFKAEAVGLLHDRKMYWCVCVRYLGGPKPDLQLPKVADA